MHKDIQSSEVFPAGYIPYRNYRKTDAHGGIFILVSEKYLSSEPSELKSEETSEQLWIKLTYLDTKNIYRIRQSQNATIWLGGDFNIRGIDWDAYSIKSKAQNTKQCKQQLDIRQNNYLEQVVTKPTHITPTSESTLDLFFYK